MGVGQPGVAVQFFPPGVFGENNFTAYTGSAHLRSMDEPSLLSRESDQPPVYRLLYVPTWKQPCVVRITETTEKWSIVCKISDGKMGSPGKLVEQADGELSKKESTRFLDLLDRASFWEMPVVDDRQGFDGSTAIMEGYSTGKYYVEALRALADVD
jgi:hypothetical protein